MPQKDSAEKAIRDIRRKARRKFSALLHLMTFWTEGVATSTLPK